MQDNFDALVDGVYRIAELAATELLQFYRKVDTLKVTQKANKTPVTAADLASDQIIHEYLAQLTPHIPILSEETPVAAATRMAWSRYWCVDPLDGTKEFIKGTDEFTINIALVEDHQPVFGLIFIPCRRECFYAGRGWGAFKRLEDVVTPIQVRPWPLDNQINVLVSRWHTPTTWGKLLHKELNYQLIKAGSSLKFCMVANGAADVYPRFGPTSEWDTAAGQCIVEEAGGVLVDLQGQPLEYNRRETLLNPNFVVVNDLEQLMKFFTIGEKADDAKS